MNTRSDIGYYRLPQIIGNPKSKPPIEPIIPVSKSTWWAGIKTGIFPKGKKLAPGITVWSKSDIHELAGQGGA